MRVLLNTYPWAFHCPGGGEIQLLKYAEYLSAAGVEALKFDLWQPGLDNCDVVHFFSVIGGSWHFCNFVKSLGLPLVISSSLWINDSNRHTYPLEDIRLQLALADAIITNGEAEADSLSHHLKLPRQRFHTVYNGVDPLFTQQVSAELFRQRFGLFGPFILNVGNVEPRKNQLALIQACNSLGLPLAHIGNVRDQAYYERCVAAADGRVRWLGPLDHSDPLLRSAYRACSLFVLPSLLETPGLAAIEAAAQGAKVVITSEGSTGEYFGDMVTFVAPSDADAIQAAILRELNMERGEELSSHVAARFTWNQVVKPLATVYADLIQASPRDKLNQSKRSGRDSISPHAGA